METEMHRPVFGPRGSLCRQPLMADDSCQRLRSCHPKHLVSLKPRGYQHEGAFGHFCWVPPCLQRWSFSSPTSLAEATQPPEKDQCEKRESIL